MANQAGGEEPWLVVKLLKDFHLLVSPLPAIACVFLVHLCSLPAVGLRPSDLAALITPHSSDHSLQFPLLAAALVNMDLGRG